MRYIIGLLVAAWLGLLGLYRTAVVRHRERIRSDVQREVETRKQGLRPMTKNLAQNDEASKLSKAERRRSRQKPEP